MENQIARLSAYQTSRFFSTNSSVTQLQCNQDATDILGAEAIPTPGQGGTSYTVMAKGSGYVVQFRVSEYTLNIYLLECVEMAYAPFVPSHQYLGELGELHVYEMVNIGGAMIYLARQNLQRYNLPPQNATGLCQVRWL